MKEITSIILSLIILAVLIFCGYYAYNVSNLLIYHGFSSPDLPIYIGKYIQYNLLLVVCLIFGKIVEQF